MVNTKIHGYCQLTSKACSTWTLNPIPLDTTQDASSRKARDWPGVLSGRSMDSDPQQLGVSMAMGLPQKMEGFYGNILLKSIKYGWFNARPPKLLQLWQGLTVLTQSHCLLWPQSGLVLLQCLDKLLVKQTSIFTDSSIPLSPISP